MYPHKRGAYERHRQPTLVAAASASGDEQRAKSHSAMREHYRDTRDELASPPDDTTLRNKYADSTSLK